MRRLTLVVIASATAGSFAQAQTHGPVTDSLRLYYVGKAVGWEHYSLDPDGSGFKYSGDLDYIDRGRRVHVQATATYSADYSPHTLEVAQVGDTSRTVTTRVMVDGPVATVLHARESARVAIPSGAFALAPFMPISQHVALLRFWTDRGMPATLLTVPGDPVSEVHIRRTGVDTVPVNGKSLALSRHAIDGSVWGTEYVWTDADGRFAMFTSANGGLSVKAVRADLVRAYDTLMTVAANTAINAVARRSFQVDVTADGSKMRTLALTGATLIDGTGHAAVSGANVIIENGQVIAAGPAATTPVPEGARRVDMTSKTIIPGLWDSHAHLNQAEWGPAYLAAGVTTVRDMGNELPWINLLRANIGLGRVLGPNMVLAGLVDAPGPNGFGAVTAATPAEGRDVVRRYLALGFEEIKLYDLLAPDVIAAIVDEAHKSQMVVTGHVPRSLGLRRAVDAGMDQIAHLQGVFSSDSGTALIAHLAAKKTVMDPTIAWGEIGSHSASEPLESFQPGAKRMPQAFTLTRANGWGSNADTATAHARLARSVAAVSALHKAGVPIIAGTDMGVPGFSIYRELELYVKAGMTPMEAILSATAVPARVMHFGFTAGTLQPGRKADLVVLDRNPLDDISNIRSVHFVMKGGLMYNSARLWSLVGVSAP